MPGKEVDWGKLLQESQNDAAHIDTKGVPPILKPLPQLAADARRLVMCCLGARGGHELFTGEGAPERG